MCHQSSLCYISQGSDHDLQKPSKQQDLGEALPTPTLGIHLASFPLGSFL